MDDLVDRLERRVLALQERRMRRQVLAESLNEMTPETLVGCTSQIVKRARSGNSNARELLQELALEPSAIRELPYNQVQEAYRIARMQGMENIAWLFLGSRDSRNPTVQEAQRDNEFLELPLGMRRAAARTSDRFVLDRLIRDRNPKVIRLLLNNPRITERDVVRIAAMRPTSVEVLDLVANHRKWASRYPVRKALMLNPHTRPSVAVGLVSTLMRQDLLEASNLTQLPNEVNEAIREQLDRNP